MRETLLRLVVRRILSEKMVVPPEGDEDDPLGEYVFASLRPDVPQPKEPDTALERDLADAFHKHFHGRPDALQSQIGTILSLQDDYPEFFMPPDRYKSAYRTLTVPQAVLEQIVGQPISESEKDGEVHVKQGGVQVPFKGRNFFSWTANPNILFGLKKNWGSLFNTDWIRRKVGASGFVAVLKADIGSNTFFLNPDRMRKTGLAGEFDYQVEVISVGDVTLDEVAFFYFDEGTPPELEATMIKQAVNAVK